MANLRIKASLDKSDYDKGLDSIKEASKSLNSSLQGLGGVGGIIAGVFGGNIISGAISSLFSMLNDKISESRQEMIKLGHDSENIGIKPSDLDEIVESFHRYGVAGDEVISMFGRMESARESALAGNKEMVKSFADLGINLQELAKKTPRGLFEAAMAHNAAVGGTGDSADAMKNIFGKGMRRPGMQRASLAFGSGGVEQGAIGLSDEAAIAEKLGGQKSHSFWKSFTNFMNKPLPGIGGWSIPGAPGTLGVSGSEIKNEQAEMQKANEKRIADNLAAIERTKKKQNDFQDALAAERERNAGDEEAERDEEIKHGLRLERPEVDSLQKRGLIAGGAPVNNLAYAEGKRQTQYQHQIAETNRKIEAHLAIMVRHTAALKAIEKMFPGLTDQGGGIQ